MKLIWILITLTLIALGLGCREHIQVSVSQTSGGPVTIRLEPLPGIFESPVEIRDLQVFRVQGESPLRLQSVWVIKTRSGKPEHVTSFTYGIVPPEFEEIKSAEPLIVGKEYDILASRPGDIGGARFIKE
jgi:hypothetical protein